MKTSLTTGEISSLVKKQLDFYIPDGYIVNDDYWKEAIVAALDRCNNCFGHILFPGYRDAKKNSLFSHLHRDQYATFLYFLANTIWLHYHEKQVCDKLLNLQSILHGFFLSYKCEMPDIFAFGHPMGSIIGNAKYSDGLYISQHVTINTHTDKEGKYDLCIGRGCSFLTGATILGNKPIGDRVTVGANVTIYNKKIDNDYSCMNIDGQVQIKPRVKDKCIAEQVFDLDFR